MHSENDPSTAYIDDCANACAIEERITSLDDVLENTVTVNEVEMGNQIFSISNFEELNEKERILMERRKKQLFQR